MAEGAPGQSQASSRSATPSARVAGTESSGAARRPGSASSSSRSTSLVAIFAPLIAPYAPPDGPSTRCAPPPRAHQLAGHQLGGQDILSQLIYGDPGLAAGRAASAVCSPPLIALFVGMISGYAEGTIVDDFLSFLTNVALVIPVLPLIIVIDRVHRGPRRRADRGRHRASPPGPAPPAASGRRSSPCATVTSSPRRSSPARARCGSCSGRSCPT